MKLYAQIGHGDGDKTALALEEELIDGAIISPRDVHPDGIEERIARYREASRDADIVLDPQFYATFAAASETARTGRLPEWPYFSAIRKN